MEKVTKKSNNNSQSTCTSSYHDENTCKISRRSVQNCKRRCAHKTPKVNVNGRTNGRMNGRTGRMTDKRTETCKPKSPMLKQVRRKGHVTIWNQHLIALHVHWKSWSYAYVRPCVAFWANIYMTVKHWRKS